MESFFVVGWGFDGGGCGYNFVLNVVLCVGDSKCCGYGYLLVVEFVWGCV